MYYILPSPKPLLSFLVIRPWFCLGSYPPLLSVYLILMWLLQAPLTHTTDLQSVMWFKPGQSVCSIPLASMMDSWISKWDSTAVCWQCRKCKLQINLLDFRLSFVLRLNSIIKTLSFSIFGPMSFDVASFSGSFFVSAMLATSRTLLWPTIHMSNFAEPLVCSTCLHIPPLGPSQLGKWSFMTGPGYPHSCGEVGHTGTMKFTPSKKGKIQTLSRVPCNYEWFPYPLQVFGKLTYH